MIYFCASLPSRAVISTDFMAEYSELLLVLLTYLLSCPVGGDQLFPLTWQFMNHPQISTVMDQEEEECLHYLTKVGSHSSHCTLVLVEVVDFAKAISELLYQYNVCIVKLL